MGAEPDLGTESVQGGMGTGSRAEVQEAGTGRRLDIHGGYRCYYYRRESLQVHGMAALEGNNIGVISLIHVVEPGEASPTYSGDIGGGILPGEKSDNNVRLHRT